MRCTKCRKERKTKKGLCKNCRGSDKKTKLINKINETKKI